MRLTKYVCCVWCLFVSVLCITSIPSCYGRQSSHEHDADADLRNLVRKKLLKVFENSDEDLNRVLYSLAKKDKLYHWENFEALINSEEAFKGYAQKLADDTKTAENNALIATSDQPVGVTMDALGSFGEPIFLALEVLRNIYRFWKGDISGVRCLNNIVYAISTTALGVWGGRLTQMLFDLPAEKALEKAFDYVWHTAFGV